MKNPSRNPGDPPPFNPEFEPAIVKHTKVANRGSGDSCGSERFEVVTPDGTRVVIVDRRWEHQTPIFLADDEAKTEYLSLPNSSFVETVEKIRAQNPKCGGLEEAARHYTPPAR